MGRDHPREMNRQSRWRFKQSLYEAVDDFLQGVHDKEEHLWLKTEATEHEVRDLTRTLLQQHTGFAELVHPNPVNEGKTGKGDHEIVVSIRALWAKLSEEDVVLSLIHI